MKNFEGIVENLETFELKIKVHGTDTIFVGDYVIVMFWYDDFVVFETEEYKKSIKEEDGVCWNCSKHLDNIIDAFSFINDQLKNKEEKQIENK